MQPTQALGPEQVGGKDLYGDIFWPVAEVLHLLCLMLRDPDQGPCFDLIYRVVTEWWREGLQEVLQCGYSQY